MRSHLAIVIGLASVLLIAGCEKKDPPAVQRPPAPVTAFSVVAMDVPRYLDEIGRCVAREMVSVQPQVSGRITQLHFTDGADIKAGDLLFTIDPRPYQTQVDAAEASLAQSKAALVLAKLEFARATHLLEKKVLSQQEYDTSQNTVDVSEARVKQNEAAVQTARLNLEYCSIRSPIDGRTGHRLVDVGNLVAPNGNSLLLIQRLDPIYAEFTVTENDLPAVQKYMATGSLQVEVRIPDDSGATRNGDLTFMDNAVQDATGTVRLRATLANPDHRFWPGQFIRARLVLAILKAAVLIPADATQLSPTGPFVYVIKPDSTAELRPVTLGQRQETRVVVEKGLASGERIVVQGHQGIMHGVKVRIEESKAAGGEAAKP